MIKARIKDIAKTATLENVRIMARKVVIGEGAKLKNVHVETSSITVGRNSIMNDTILLSNDRIEIGKLVQIKEKSVLKAFKGVKIGDRTIIDRGVVVAGLQSERSYFEVGSRCVVLHHTYINNAREVIIGDNVGIGGYCMIFTHGVWQNVFKGYPYKFGQVEIKDDAWLPWHVFVMPGVTIGKGATIAGGSVVTKDIPDYCLAAGAPAKIIRRENYPQQLSTEEKSTLAKTVLKDFEGYFRDFIENKSIRMIELKNGAVIVLSDIGNFVYTYKVELEQLNVPELTSVEEFDVVSFTIPKALKDRRCWVELDTETRSPKVNKLTSDFVQFLRRYGVRVIDE